MTDGSLGNLKVVGTGACIPATRPTTMESLKYRRANLESQLADINEAILLMENNPTITTVLEALAKVGSGY